MNFKRLFTRLSQVIIHKPVIVDETYYGDNYRSYSGNSLCGANILIVSNVTKIIKILQSNIDKIEKTEQCFITVSDTNTEGISCLYNHVINIYEIQSVDDVYDVYSCLQKGLDYLIQNNQHGTICTCIIGDRKSVPEIEALSGLIEGLGYVAPDHYVTLNGLISEGDVNIDSVLHAALFLSSKYAQLLTGQVLYLGNSNI